MLDFRPRVQPRNYLSRREQRRLLAWVMGIGLIAIACTSLMEMRWFAGGGSGGAVAGGRSIDTRFQPSRRGSSEPDAVSIVKSEAAVVVSDHDDILAGVDSELLAHVRDDTPWIRSAEVDAWLNVWSALAQSSDAELARRSDRAVGFVELFQQPRAFRGKAVTIRGNARQATYIDAAENSKAIEGYYRVVVQPESGPAEPMFLYALELPTDFPLGEKILADIEATGVFFKRMVYPAKDDELRRAPVIMARTLTWRQPAAVEDSGVGSLLGGLLALTALGTVGLIAMTYWVTRIRTLRDGRRPATMPPIDDHGAVSVEESLRKLAETDR